MNHRVWNHPTQRAPAPPATRHTERTDRHHASPSPDRYAASGPTRLRSALRIGQIAGILALSTLIEIPTVAAAARRRDGDALGRSIGRATGRTLWRLGPAFVKIGQLLSTRPDVLGTATSGELQRSLALGADAPRTCAGQSTSAKSGSVADVRRIELAGGPVAVKSIRHNVPDALIRDTALMEAAARLLDPISGGLPIAALTTELCEAVRRQASLEHELTCLKLLATLQKNHPVVVPKPLERYSSSRRLVMTWLDGQDEPRAADLAHPQSADPRDTARHLMAAVFEMLFITGAVHCDLHPGNWWRMPDGRIAIVDAGFVVTLDDQMRAHFARFFLGLASGDGDLCADAALAVAVDPPSPSSQSAFRAEMRELVTKIHGQTAGQFSLVAFATDFFNIQRRHGAISRSEFVFPIAALLVIEGQVRKLDPDLDFQTLAATQLQGAHL